MYDICYSTPLSPVEPRCPMVIIRLSRNSLDASRGIPAKKFVG